MSFSPASLIANQSRVWIEQGTETPLTAQAIASQYARQYEDEGRVASLAHPVSGTKCPD